MSALTTTEQNSNVQTWRSSTDAASMCKEIVVKRAINLQGRRYVPVEGWQAIAVAHGCVASAENVRILDDGVSAEGVIRRMSDGKEIARAEGFVGKDEPVWFGGKTNNGKLLPKRPDFAIRAMAQTRAVSRACRSAFAHVVVLMDVGLETTPYEEMAGVFDVTPQRQQSPEQPPVDHFAVIKAWVAHAQSVANILAVEEKWKKRVAKLNEQGTPIPLDVQEAAEDLIADRYGVLFEQERQQAEDSALASAEEMPA